ncbi:MAG: hypothetical protein Q8O03_04480 [Nanoarchaeota archaeon]|nr:hypothetical protein [Nanoarchaeota archaeon]
MESSYKGITLEGEEYKIKIQCKDYKQCQRAINFLDKKLPYIVEGLALLLKINESSERDFEILDGLVKELDKC